MVVFLEASFEAAMPIFCQFIFSKKTRTLRVNPFALLSTKDEYSDEDPAHLVEAIAQSGQLDRGNCTMIAPKMGVDFMLACVLAQQTGIVFGSIMDDVFVEFINTWGVLSDDFTMLQRAQILCEWANYFDLSKSEHTQTITQLAAEEFFRLADKKLLRVEEKGFEFNVLNLNVLDFFQQNLGSTWSADLVRAVVMEKTGVKLTPQSGLGKRSSESILPDVQTVANAKRSKARE